ncbi:ferredoxin [Clostridium puniceum]|uniref:Ferredoxin n=1 Tax=Clostridium puniceum TaxID=29367 RepID=A0A1S8T7P3_9CLOT|nr:EFR1 family ferrodoxin [Clostridium puniceum]OOM73820.1 ferredoxin [Clostridium puniceum]
MIFYFSATGNCKQAAEQIASQESDRLISITEAMLNEQFSYAVEDNEKIGFILPTYFYSTPRIVLDFAEKLSINNSIGKYVYIVLTFGTKTGKAGITLKNVLEKRGITVSAQYSIQTVDNYLPEFDIPTGEELQKVLKKADMQIKDIMNQISDEKHGDMNSFEGTIPKIIAPLALQIYQHQRKTSNFVVTNKCVGCGLCQKVCPVSAIEIKDKNPIWIKDKCTLCFGCLHRCPKAAIEYGKKTVGKGRYMNPNTKLYLK